MEKISKRERGLQLFVAFEIARSTLTSGKPLQDIQKALNTRVHISSQEVYNQGSLSSAYRRSRENRAKQEKENKLALADKKTMAYFKCKPGITVKPITYTFKNKNAMSSEKDFRKGGNSITGQTDRKKTTMKQNGSSITGNSGPTSTSKGGKTSGFKENGKSITSKSNNSTPPSNGGNSSGKSTSSAHSNPSSKPKGPTR